MMKTLEVMSCLFKVFIVDFESGAFIPVVHFFFFLHQLFCFLFKITKNSFQQGSVSERGGCGGKRGIFFNWKKTPTLHRFVL